jgi:hypothetical protein
MAAKTGIVFLRAVIIFRVQEVRSIFLETLASLYRDREDIYCRDVGGSETRAHLWLSLRTWVHYALCRRSYRRKYLRN